jgi:choice-of-anchor C domain-containing protein
VIRLPPLAASILTLVLWSVPPAYAIPILINGSFEVGPPPFGNQDIDIPAGSTAITGWVVTGGGIDLNEDPWDVADGVRAVDLDGRNALAGGIQQTFATMAGRLYVVSFGLSGNPGGGPAVKHARVSVDGFSADYAHDSAGQTIEALLWQTFTFSFVASSGSATLSFTSLTPFPNSFGALIDDVRVDSVAEPSTVLLLALGGAVAAVRRRSGKHKTS